MPSQSFRIGVSQMSLSQPNGTQLPSASSMGFTVQSASAVTGVFNSIDKPLNAGTSYSVILAFLGQDTVNGGYTVTQSTSAVTGLSVTSSKPYLYVNVPVANLPAGVSGTPAVAIFLAAGAANYQLAGFGYLSGATDFDYYIQAQPLQSAPGGFTASLLQSSTTDPVLGSRGAYGWSFSAVSPTTEGVHVRRSTSTVTVSPDNAGDFPVAVTRTAEISFKLLPNDIINVVQGNAGNYVQFTNRLGTTIQQAEMSLYTAAALIPGNAPLTMLMPPDALGNQEIRLYLGQLLQNQTENTEDWTKTATAPIGYTWSAAPVDKLLISEYAEIQVKFGA